MFNLPPNSRIKLLIHLLVCLSFQYNVEGTQPKRLAIDLMRKFYPDHEDIYLAKLKIGDNPQMFEFVLDTNADESWIVSDKLDPEHGYHCGESCKIDQDFGETNYIGVKMTGTVVQDEVVIKAFPDNKQNEIEVKYSPPILAVSEADLSGIKFSAVFGLSPIKSDMLKALFGKLHPRSEELIGFWYNPIFTSKYGGDVTIGGLNPSRYDATKEVTYHKTNAANQWSLQMASVRLVCLDGKVELCPTGKCNAFLDSGTSWIYAPKEAVELIRSKIKGSLDNDGWRVDCDEFNRHAAELVFKIDAKRYKMGSSQLNLPIQENNRTTCFLTIVESNGSDWILGTRFMTGYYTVFDYKNKQVAFAKKVAHLPRKAASLATKFVPVFYK